MLSATFLIWVALLGILAWIIYWHIQENRQLSENWHKKFDRTTAQWLTRFAWSRTFQLIAALGGCILVIIFYSWRLDDANTTITDLMSATQSAIPEAKRPVEQAESQKAFYPPPSAGNTSPPAASPPPLQPDAAQSPPSPPSVNDVFNTDTAQDTQSVLDDMKQRYENILVTYLFLNKCGRAETDDYYLIMAALRQEMESAHAAAHMQNDVLSAAQGSYNEMYRDNACDSIDIDSLYAGYSSYLKSLAQFVKR